MHAGAGRGPRGRTQGPDALADGHRESAESRADLLRDCRRRGMRAPVLAVGDGALGSWAALREVFPSSREQRCWVQGSQRAGLPAQVGPARGPAALAEIGDAEDRGHTETAVREFEAAGLAMAFKLLETAQDRWRAVNGLHLVALVRACATWHEGSARRTAHRGREQDQEKAAA